MLAIILTHRIALIITVVCATVLPLLPYIFQQEGDERFVLSMATALQRTVWLGLAVLVVSGLFRLQLVVPSWIGLKFAVAAVLLAWEAYGERLVGTRRYQILQLAGVLLTASTGLLVALL